jgi:hypothetical protein
VTVVDIVTSKSEILGIITPLVVVFLKYSSICYQSSMKTVKEMLDFSRVIDKLTDLRKKYKVYIN